MNNNNIWGPPAWTFLHTVTYNYPENPTDNDKRNFYNFFMSLQHVLPCNKCKAHYQQNIQKYDLSEDFKPRKYMVKPITELTNAKICRVNICDNIDLQIRDYILVVPTIIFFENGKEYKRLEADFTFELKTTKEELQIIIDKKLGE